MFNLAFMTSDALSVLGKAPILVLSFIFTIDNAFALHRHRIQKHTHLSHAIQMGLEVR